jgi:hypothetical protein
MKNLKLGDSGRDVEVWQRFLAQIWLVELDAMSPGYFDEVTDRVTREFQVENNLDETGEVDGKTVRLANYRGLMAAEAMVAKGPTRSTIVLWVAILVLISVLLPTIITPNTTLNKGGIALPLAPQLVPGSPPAPNCPGAFC